MRRIAIVGGGISGLACAYELKKLGFHPIVYEKSDRVGGRMTTLSRDGKVFDTGAQAFSADYTSAYKLCEELGIHKDWRELGKNVHFSFFKKGKKIKVVNSFSFLSHFPFSSKIQFALFMIYLTWKARNHNYFDLEKKERKIETLSAKEYLLRHIDKKTLDEFLDPILYAISSLNTEDLNLTVFLEIFNQFRKFRFEMYCFEKGMKTFYDALANRLDVRCNRSVLNVTPRGKGVEIETKDGVELYDAAVLALNAPTTREIYRDLTPMHREVLEQAEYKSTIVLALDVPLDPIRKLPLIVFPPSESALINSCLCPHLYSKQPVKAKSKDILSVFLYEKSSLELMNSPDEKIYSIVIEEMLRILPFLEPYRNQITPFAIKKWERSLPKNRGNFTEKVRELWQKGQGINHIYLCGDYLNAPFVEGSIRSGQKAAQLLASSAFL